MSVINDFLLSKRSFLIKIRTLYMAMLLISPACLALPAGEKNKNTNVAHVISDYRISLVSLPLDYYLLEKVQHPRAMLKRYNLNSQIWSPQGVVSPDAGRTGAISIYLLPPEKKLINNGNNNNGVRDASTSHKRALQYQIDNKAS